MEGFEGNLETWSCDINGDFFLSKHVFHPKKDTEIFGKTFEVQQVDRVMMTEDNSWKTSSFYISGNLVKEISSSHTYTIHLNPFSDFPPENFANNLQEKWQKDLELMTTYLNYKEHRKCELQQVASVSRNILRDYVASILRNKPKFVLDFTLEFLRKLERNAIDREVFRTANRRRHQQNWSIFLFLNLNSHQKVWPKIADRCAIRNFQ